MKQIQNIYLLNNNNNNNYSLSTLWQLSIELGKFLSGREDVMFHKVITPCLYPISSLFGLEGHVVIVTTGPG